MEKVSVLKRDTKHALEGDGFADSLGDGQSETVFRRLLSSTLYVYAAKQSACAIRMTRAAGI